MKITVEQSYLAAALATVSRLTISRSLPVLNNVLLETGDDIVTLTTTDLDSAVRVKVPAVVEAAGSITVPAVFTANLVNRLKKSSVTLEDIGGTVSLRSGKSEYSILAMPAEDYPVIPHVENGAHFTMPQGVLKEMLQLTTYAASREESRSILMGAHFNIKPSGLELCATDTHRLAKVSYAAPEAFEVEAQQRVVPVRALKELVKSLCDESEDVVTVRIGDGQIAFETADMMLISRVLDGQYPNVEKVIPKSHDRSLTLNRKDFLDAIKRLGLVAKESADKLVLSPREDVVSIAAESADMGTGQEEVACHYEGEPLEIAFNSKYLIEVLGLLETETVTLQLTGALNPGLLTAQGAPHDFLQVLMPMQV